MATFIGYNTIDAVKKYTLVDRQLIIRDLLNAFNIKAGELVGRPQYGSNIWTLIFEPMDAATQESVETTCQRIVEQDPRLQLLNINLYPYDNGMLMELEVIITPATTAEFLQVFFDRQTNTASLI